jgi:putative transposase
MRKERGVVAGHLVSDHAHMLISIPPKCPVASVIGFVKEKSAIHIARSFMGRRRNFVGQNLGHEVSSFQPSVWISLLFMNISESKNKRTIGWINSN